MTLVTVLTGDLIGSTGAAPEATDLAMSDLARTAETLSRITGQKTRFTRFRGDGWQICLTGSAFTLRATLMLIAALKSSGSGLSSRISAATGPATHLGSRDLSDASGPAFTLSGRNLDTMTTIFNNFTYAAPNDPAPWRPALLDLAVGQARNWTPEQAEAALLVLDLPRGSDETLAKSLGISRQAFQSRLKGAGTMALSRALNAFEQKSAQAETGP